MSSSKLKVIIIEDEALSRSRMVRFISNDIRLKLIGEFESFEKIIDTDLILKADLFFLDINLPGINGIKAAELLNDEQIIIFTTAYSKYAFEAFVVKAFDFLLKPVSETKFKKSISRAVYKYKINQFYDKYKNSDYIYIKNGINAYKLQFNQIYCIKSDNNHVKVYTKNKEYLLKNSLNKIDNEFDSTVLIRCHRTCIVNIYKIIKIIPKGSTKVAILENNIIAPLSRLFLKSNKDILGKFYF